MHFLYIGNYTRQPYWHQISHKRLQNCEVQWVGTALQKFIKPKSKRNIHQTFTSNACPQLKHSSFPPTNEYFQHILIPKSVLDNNCSMENWKNVSSLLTYQFQVVRNLYPILLYLSSSTYLLTHTMHNYHSLQTIPPSPHTNEPNLCTIQCWLNNIRDYTYKLLLVQCLLE